MGAVKQKGTQNLRRTVHGKDWTKHNFRFQNFIDGVEQVSITHEIDHVRRSGKGTIALEIEWNNKDPFFDRDLENFQRLHAQSAISLGVIVTRGVSMQSGLVEIVRRRLAKSNVVDETGLSIFDMKDRTSRQRAIVAKAVAGGATYQEAFSKQFVADKFGQATTHWSKLEERVARGVGNPCPLLLVGLPASIVVE